MTRYALCMSEAVDIRILRGIAIYKFTKVVTLLLLSMAAFDLAGQGLLRELVVVVEQLPLVAGHQKLRHVLAAVSGITSHRFELAGFVALGYALLFGIEGFGLWLRRSWAEYLTVVSTSRLIPFEIWALFERLTFLRLLLLVLNVAIVAYLAHILWQRRVRFASPAQGTSDACQAAARPARCIRCASMASAGCCARCIAFRCCGNDPVWHRHRLEITRPDPCRFESGRHG